MNLRVVGLGVLILGALAQAEERKKVDPWEGSIRNFEKSDEKNPPPKGAVLFVGSSSIAGWDLRKYFPGLKAINRGFGGSQIADAVRFVHRIVWPYEPSTIVFYSGDNDLASGKTPEQVLADFRAFVARVHEACPKARILFISIKPSLSRWRLIAQMRRANELIQEFIRGDERLQYVDVAAAMLGADGQPRRELFVADGLHLSVKGYVLWTLILSEHLGLLRPASL